MKRQGRLKPYKNVSHLSFGHATALMSNGASVLSWEKKRSPMFLWANLQPQRSTGKLQLSFGDGKFQYNEESHIKVLSTTTRNMHFWEHVTQILQYKYDGDKDLRKYKKTRKFAFLLIILGNIDWIILASTNFHIEQHSLKKQLPNMILGMFNIKYV